MKHILITGVNSYVGNSLADWLNKEPDKYKIEKISLRNDKWKQHDFSGYDVIVHVAGIAHVSTDPKMEELYYKVNRDLTIEVAKKAKVEGVKQFIFLSSIIVYGEMKENNGIITKDTIPNPNNFYGKSKLEAEKGIEPLQSEHFKIAIIRPPMIYGKGSKGNYPKLAKLARITPIFPDYDNKRSMIHIDNLTEFIRLIIDNEESGLFFPQNSEYVKTSEMVKLIAEVHGRKLKLVELFNPIIKRIKNKINILNKIFGNLSYDKKISKYKEDYNLRNFKESIYLTEKKGKMNKNIDVLILTDNGLETVGGEQESTKIIINGIKNYYSLGVIQPGMMSNKEDNVYYFFITKKTRIKHLIKNPISFIVYMWKVKGIIKSTNPKIIHTQAQASFFMVAFLKKFKLVQNDFKLIHTERGLYTKYNLIIKKIFEFFIKELDVMVTTTEYNLKLWTQAIEKKNLSLILKVIENTPGAIFETYDNKKEKLVQKDKIVIGFAGRYCEWKNWPLAIEISEKLNNILGEKLIVKMAVGCLDKKAFIETEKMFGRMKSIFGNRFSGRINIDLEEMNNFYYEIDIFILTSKPNTESFGRTLVEAMSRKTIVLTTDSGGSVEVVGDRSNVLNTAEEFVNKILVFYNNKDLLKKEKEKNLLRVREKYSLRNNIDKHLSLYKSLF